MKRTVPVLPEKLEALSCDAHLALCRQLAALVGAQQAEIERLLLEIASLRAGVCNQRHAPFSKGKKPGKHKKSGRKKGEGKFTNLQPPEPGQVTDTIDVEAPSCCPHCGSGDITLRLEDLYLTDLPEPRPVIKHYRRPVGTCGGCRKTFRAPHPDLAQNQYGATAHRLGPRLLTASSVLHYKRGVPVQKVPAIFHDLHGVRVTQSALTQDALRRAEKGPLLARFEKIGRTVKRAKVLHADFTGWSKAGTSATLGIFATPDAPDKAGVSLYRVLNHHGAEEIREVIGEKFSGVLVTDRGAEFDATQFDDLRKQKCNTHLKRNVGEALECKVNAARDFGENLRGLLDDARALRKDYDDNRRDDYPARVAKLEEQLTFHLRPRKLTDSDNQRLLDGIGFQHDNGSVLRFLHDPAVNPDNHLAERQLRFAITARKVSHCNKNDRGGHAHSVHTTVEQTEHRRAVKDQSKASLVDRLLPLFRNLGSLFTSQPQAP